MKIIFLDIDGVLNSRQYDSCRGAVKGNIDESRLPLLSRLMDQTGAKVVLTSSWRRHWDPTGVETDHIGEELTHTFGRYGIILYDKTPDVGNDRSKEIRKWISEHPFVKRYVIFDDNKFGWGDLEANVIKTDYRIGKALEQKHIDKAIELLLQTE